MDEAAVCVCAHVRVHMCVCAHVCMCVFWGENKDKEVEEGGQSWKGFCPLHPGGHQVSLKAGDRGCQSRQYKSELYLHVGYKETQCKRGPGSVSNRRQY